MTVRMALTPGEAEIIKGLRVERGIYNAALDAAVLAVKDEMNNWPRVFEEDVSAVTEALAKAILALRKE